MRLLREEK